MKKMTLPILAVLALAAACGGGGNTYGDDDPAPQPDAAFDAVKPVIARNCAGCHNGSTHPLRFDSGAKFRASKAKAKLTGGLMPPPPKTISDEDKRALLAYLGG